ncbi:unknown [Clostridium sp. CAG:571]|nr:unknown [Clostridium sp. CAG:571]
MERPKRRKHKDSHYVLLELEENNTYKISFKDGIGTTM